MNLASKAPDGGWYVVGVLIDSDDTWLARARCLWPDGSLRVEGGTFAGLSKPAAESKARDLIKVKIKKAKHSPASIEMLPERAAIHLAMKTDKWMSPKEMMRQIEAAKRERYVKFCELTGIEDRFDDHLDYIAMTTDDPEFLLVYDREGKLFNCHVSRLSEVRLTELAVEVGMRL